MFKHINNPFIMLIAILQIGGFVYYFCKGNWKLGFIVLFYSLANVLLSLLKGQ